jgi:hypothetical protein
MGLPDDESMGWVLPAPPALAAATGGPGASALGRGPAVRSGAAPEPA